MKAPVTKLVFLDFDGVLNSIASAKRLKVYREGDLNEEKHYKPPHSERVVFVILDDDSNLAPFAGRHVRTSHAVGLTETDADKAVLKHSLGHTNARETVLTRTEFCRRLTLIKEDTEMTGSPEKFRIRVIGTQHWLGPRWITEALQESTMPNAGAKLRGSLYPAAWWVPAVRAKVWPNIGQLKSSVTKAGVRGFPILEVVLQDRTVRPLDDVLKEYL